MKSSKCRPGVLAHKIGCSLELRTVLQSAVCLLGKNTITSSLAQGIKLQVCILVLCRNARAPINMYHISKTYLSICSDGHTFKILFYDIIALSPPNWRLMFVRHLKKDRLRDMHIWFVNRMAILVLINFFNVPCLWHIHYKMTKGGLHKNHIQRRPS